ncbi:TIGR02687 family protein [Halanaerobium congolense]|uniref:TIGR02687 family protein n=1 Tax=Halanaerobium congolense TaxID=54121 RepID=A0A1G8K2D8_9FIRM|nr:BREX-1 system phosphatase PglZ type A [Halanaerobium congolense]SDI37559.1 TIGR02687 family protein [Halanaerobium congolense]SET03621.1 TIGR02687 family protein [Halanaerobium congolense]
MNLDEIKNLLEKEFNQATKEKGRHIIFWYDTNADFVEEIDDLEIDNAKIWKLKDNNNFRTKYQLEVEDTKSNYLIYSSQAKPDKKKNWLLDIYRYSQEFTADKTTLIMRDFGVEEEYMRPAFEKHEKFFNNKQRYNRLKDYDIKDFNQEKLDIAIFSALAKLKTPNLERAVKELLKDVLNEDNSIWEKLNKFSYSQSIWDLISKKYGYVKEEKSLKQLMLMFLITNIRHNLKRDLPENWQNELSTEEANCVVFLSNWMNHAKDYKEFDQKADKLQEDLSLKDYLKNWDINDYLQCESFRAFDEMIIKKIVDNLVSGSEEFNNFKEIISIRKTKHWYQYFNNTYQAVDSAIELLRLKKEVGDIPQLKAEQFFEKYKEEYYQFDKAYRHFYLAYDQVKNKGILAELKERIENLYSNWFIQELSIKFSNSLADKKEWKIGSVKQQQKFYYNNIRKKMDKEERTFVIISDGFRYEAAQELNEQLQKEFKSPTELMAYQGSIPSETSLGMASLLPNNKINIDQEFNQILVDGMPTNSSKNREKVLNSYVEKSVVLSAKELLQMTRDEMREVIFGKNLVYVYHDLIDTMGESHQTEQKVFEAVNDTFADLKTLINALKNNVSASNIFITADHGFIYRRRKLEASDKTKHNAKDSNKESKRYLINKEKQDVDGALTFSLNYLAEDNDLYVSVPRGANRFSTRGGSLNYVHGGSSLQEIVIPIIKFKYDRKGKYKASKVDLKLTNISRKITNSIFRLEFFQTDSISEKITPRKVLAYFVDDEGNKISNENIIIADSKEEDAKKRNYKEKFTLKNQQYDENKDYYLILEDQDESVEKIYEKIAFKISLAITNDFGF